MISEERNNPTEDNQGGENEPLLKFQGNSVECEPSTWRVLAASVQGLSHQQGDKPCQDHHFWTVLPHDVLVACVADGAGSAKLSEVGAFVASHAAVEAIAQRTEDQELPGTEEAWRLLLANALKAALTALENEAITRDIDLRDLATTLILIVAMTGTVAAAQIGDGAAIISDASGNIHVLTTPEHGEYINTTTFVMSPSALETAQFNVWHGEVGQIATFSDGLQKLALEFPAKTPFIPFFQPLFTLVGNVTDDDSSVAAQEQINALLLSPRVRERADDDLTLLLAAKGAPLGGTTLP